MAPELPDILAPGLKILFIGYNPGLRSAETGHHYAGKSNGFWKLLFESGLTPWRFQPEEDRQLLSLSYGSTNIAPRPTRSAAELSREELLSGAAALKQVLARYHPEFACYMGIGVYRIVSGQKTVTCGLQPENAVTGVTDYVCSSPSGLNRLPYKDQLACFAGLKALLG